MAFDDSTITAFDAWEENGDLVVTWQSSLPAGTTFQVYLDRRLAWHGTDRVADLPLPGDDLKADIAIGAVAAGEALTDFSASLPAPPGTGDQVTLKWTGGTYEDDEDDLAGFHVYQSPTPGAAIDYVAPVATIAAYPAGVIEDGFGIGGFGDGGFGRSASYYSWQSGHLANGVWQFGVRPFDAAGNEGTASTFTATIAAAPGPPAANAAGLRLTYSYNPATRVATLNWLASPG